MPLHVISFTSSSSADDRANWSDEDYNGLFIAKALRRKAFNGRCIVKIAGQAIGVRSGERELALKWFANTAHRYLFENKCETPIALIPMPNVNAVDVNQSCDTTEQATELASSIGKDAFVLDIVRWREAIADGEHDPKYFYDHSVVYPSGLMASPRKTTVLVDEICSNAAATLRGVAAKLRAHGVNIDFVLSAAHVPTSAPPKEVFTAHRQQFDDF